MPCFLLTAASWEKAQHPLLGALCQHTHPGNLAAMLGGSWATQRGHMEVSGLRPADVSATLSVTPGMWMRSLRRTAACDLPLLMPRWAAPQGSTHTAESYSAKWGCELPGRFVTQPWGWGRGTNTWNLEWRRDFHLLSQNSQTCKCLTIRSKVS